MRKSIFVFILLTVFACEKKSQEDSITFGTSKITGSWQYVARSYSIGGPLINETVENGGIYNFALDGTFTFEYVQDDTLDFSGRYTFQKEILTLDYVLMEEPIKRTLKAQFEADTLELIPINPMCIEGCSFTLQRL